MEPEDEACVPAGKSMQKVPSLSDLSDPESSLGEYNFQIYISLELNLNTFLFAAVSYYENI